jgi:hypothetical protein
MAHLGKDFFSSLSLFVFFVSFCSKSLLEKMSKLQGRALRSRRRPLQLSMRITADCGMFLPAVQCLDARRRAK